MQNSFYVLKLKLTCSHESKTGFEWLKRFSTKPWKHFCRPCEPSLIDVFCLSIRNGCPVVLFRSPVWVNFSVHVYRRTNARNTDARNMYYERKSEDLQTRGLLLVGKNRENQLGSSKSISVRFEFPDVIQKSKYFSYFPSQK